MPKLKKDFGDVFRGTFDSPDGQTMLYYIADQCGYFASDPEQIKPDLLAFFHRMLAMAGINPRTAGYHMQALMDVSKHYEKGVNSDDEI